MAEQQCPLCKSDSYLNPNIKILISPCFHKLCEQCVYKLFAHGQAPCPECQTPLRRINFITSTFEDVEVEREIRIRRMLSVHFTRPQGEFDDVQGYNDYLEAFENLVFSLAMLRTETHIKEQIAQIRGSESILNPAVAVKKQVARGAPEEDAKKPRTDERIWGVFYDTAPQRPAITKEAAIPPGIMTPLECGGLSREAVVRFIVDSLFDF